MNMKAECSCWRSLKERNGNKVDWGVTTRTESCWLLEMSCNILFKRLTALTGSGHPVCARRCVFSVTSLCGVITGIWFQWFSFAHPSSFIYVHWPETLHQSTLWELKLHLIFYRLHGDARFFQIETFLFPQFKELLRRNMVKFLPQKLGQIPWKATKFKVRSTDQGQKYKIPEFLVKNIHESKVPSLETRQKS